MRMARTCILVISIIVTLTVGINGCMAANESFDDYSYESFDDYSSESFYDYLSRKACDDMLRHMREKYGHEFIELSFEPRNWVTSYDILKCYPEGGNPETDYVRVTRHEEDNEITFTDTYFGIVIREEVEGIINDICHSLSLKSKAFSPADDTIYGDEYDTTKSFEDVRNIKDYSLTLIIAIAFEHDTDTEIFNNELCEKIETDGINGTFIIYFIPEEVFSTLSRENYREILLQKENVISRHFNIID